MLRRDALLAAAVTVGLARRSGDAAATAATWARVAPVVAGADVELLLLDVWGELSVVAEQVSPTDRDLIVDAMRTALDRAGSPWWAVAADRWWQLERAVVAEDQAAAAAAAAELDTLAAEHARLRGRADAAAAWAAVLAGRVCPVTVDAAAAQLADAGLRGEAADLCRAAAQRATDPAATRRLLGAGRGLLPGTGGSGRASGLLSEREREVGALVVDGLTQKEIGARLYISPKTVEQHVARMRQKLAASNRAALVAALRTQLGAVSGHPIPLGAHRCLRLPGPTLRRSTVRRHGSSSASGYTTSISVMDGPKSRRLFVMKRSAPARRRWRSGRRRPREGDAPLPGRSRPPR